MRVPVPKKFERNGWPSVERPDPIPPEGWNRDEQADIYIMPAKRGWPSRISLNRISTNYYGKAGWRRQV